MIEVVHPASGESGLALRLTPNRSAAPGELVACFSGIAALALGVAWTASAQGNVFAPAFALVVVAVVGAAFVGVRRRLAREETIAFTPDAVVVRRHPSSRDVRFQTGWVRVEDEPGATPNARHRLLLGSHGRRVEIGAFLAEGEREELKHRVIEALATVKGAARNG
jgi:uncharacterized membrane protein